METGLYSTLSTIVIRQKDDGVRYRLMSPPHRTAILHAVQILDFKNAVSWCSNVHNNRKIILSFVNPFIHSFINSFILYLYRANDRVKISSTITPDQLSISHSIQLFFLVGL